MMKTIIRYLKQPSTWKGIIGMITGCGVVLSPEQAKVIIACGVGIAGAIDMFWDTDK